LVVRVAAKDDTRVQTILVRTGDEVAEGQVIVRLDEADLQARVEQARAHLAAQESELKRAERELDLTVRQAAATVHEAEAQLAAARARLGQAEAERELRTLQQPDEVRQAEADLSSARSQLTDADATLRRMEKLLEEGAVSQHLLDSARTDFQVALATVQAAEAAVAVARARDFEGRIREQQVATRAAEEKEALAGLESARTMERLIALREEEVLAKGAAVAEAEAALDFARVTLSDAVLRSPVNGVVVKGYGRSVKDGEVVEKGQPIVTLLSTEVSLWISASVSELHIDRVRQGQPALIRLDAFRRRWFHGDVEKVGRATEFASDQSSPWMVQRVPLKIRFDPEGMDIRNGMTCQVWIDVRKRG
jgi:multidrug resistance efflux pump